MSKEKALQIGAKAFFKQRYPDKVKVYSIDKFSKEICNGPHVKSTEEIGEIKIYKIKKSSRLTLAFLKEYQTLVFSLVKSATSPRKPRRSRIGLRLRTNPYF